MKYLRYRKCCISKLSNYYHKNIIAEGDHVVIESTGKATTRNGKPYDQTYCDVFKFYEGKLQEINTYLDTALSVEPS